MPEHANVLKDSGKPTLFEVDAGSLGLAAPSVRAGRGEAVRLAVRSLTAMQKEALVVSARTGKAWRLSSDEGAYLDGHDQAPCPLSFLSTGMVSSYMNEVLALAKQRGIALRDFALVQDNYYTMKGSVRKGTMTGGARDIDLEAQVDTSADDATLRGLVLDAVAASPLNGLMHEHRESLFTLSHNGQEIGTARALTVDGPALPEPDTDFTRATIKPTDHPAGIVHTGEMTPPNENTKTFAGGSLQEKQDRLLHISVTCRLRSDGVKEITQRLYNPHGSIYRFLSEEAPENGGRGRYPDAGSYMAAGIGFCFMTQFGRYAKIVGRPLSDYRIVQDMHMSLGGASGGTGRRGECDPLETHCYLRSAEDDDYARTCLDMAEQTCFLHALCKAELKARVRISRRAAVA